MERGFDCQGRLILPAEMRSKLGIKASDNLYIGLSGNVIYISKDKVTDFICRKIDVLTMFKVTGVNQLEISIIRN